MYQWTEPFVADHATFDEAFGPFAATPLDEAVRRAVAWYLEREREEAA